MPRKRPSTEVPSPGTAEFSTWFGQQLADHIKDPAGLIDVLRAVTNIRRIKIMLLMSDISDLVTQAGLLNIEALALFDLLAEEMERDLAHTIGGLEKLAKVTAALKAVARDSVDFVARFRAAASRNPVSEPPA